MTPGIHRIPMAQYLADPCPVPSLSSSALTRLITRSPAHAHHEHPRLGKAQGDAANKADIGTVAHDILLGGEHTICVIDPEDYAGAKGAVPKGWTNNAIREARDTARANGLTPILKGQELAAKAMARKAREFIADTELAGVFDSGEPELTIIAQQGETWLRTRPDWFSPAMMVMLHYKTTEASVEPESFIRGVMRGMGYGTALAFYKHVAELAGVCDHQWRHFILAQEQDAPYACSLVGLSPAREAVEMAKVMNGIATWAQCMRTGKWPAYSNQVHYAEATAWELSYLEQQG